MGGLSDIGKIGAALVNPTAILGTAAAMGDTLYGAYANKKEASRERDWQKYMVDYQNAYNTPAAQMARYAEAGLNPNLIYGQSNMSASTGSVPHASIPASHIADRGLAALRLGQSLELGQSQIDQVQANTALLREQARGAGANADILENLKANTPKWMDPREKGLRASVIRAFMEAFNKEVKRPKDPENDIGDWILEGMSN